MAGLFTMHTMGHSLPAGHGMIEPHAEAITAPVSPMSSMDPTDLCVAVLVGVAVVLTVLLALRRSRPEPTQPRTTPADLGHAGRDPPIVHIGLTVTALSEMRN